MYRVGRQLLAAETDGTYYRLLGIGLSNLEPAADCDPPDLLDRQDARRTAAELAIDKVRAKFGDRIIRKGTG